MSRATPTSSTGGIDFREFVVGLFEFCSLDPRGLFQLAFKCFAEPYLDLGERKYLVTDRERDRLLDEVYGAGNRRRFTAERELLGLSVRGTGGEHTPIGADGTIDLSPSKRLFISEAEIITALFNGIKELQIKENEAGYKR